MKPPLLGLILLPAALIQGCATTYGCKGFPNNPICKSAVEAYKATEDSKPVNPAHPEQEATDTSPLAPAPLGQKSSAHSHNKRAKASHPVMEPINDPAVVRMPPRVMLDRAVAIIMRPSFNVVSRPIPYSCSSQIMPALIQLCRIPAAKAKIWRQTFARPGEDALVPYPSQGMATRSTSSRIKPVPGGNCLWMLASLAWKIALMSVSRPMRAVRRSPRWAITTS